MARKKSSKGAVGAPGAGPGRAQGATPRSTRVSNSPGRGPYRAKAGDGLAALAEDTLLAPPSPPAPLAPRHIAAGPLLDAWYGSFSDAFTIAMMRRNPTLARAVAETVFIDDSRTQVSNTTDYPYRCICWLVITAQDGQYGGTGWIVGPRTVITAGHCVFMQNFHDWVKQIDVYPGRNGPDTPYAFTSNQFRSVAAWTEQGDPKSDYGAIILSSPIPNLKQFGTFFFQSLDDGTLAAKTVTVAGYPGDKDRGTLWKDSRQLLNVTAQNLIYDISTYGGQSGSPVYYMDGDNPTAVGIHNYGDVSSNSATRITDSAFDDLTAWQQEGGVPGDGNS